MDENCRETALDYETIVPILKKYGYNSYISTEYEGQRFFHDLEYGSGGADEIDQVRRHQIQLKNLIEG
jgi:sugar phosphate isomerase/epimerase